jgi:hypothetical protein
MRDRARRAYDIDMQSAFFRIVPLSSEIADAAREKARENAPDHVLIVVDSATGYPCRHCLRWAQPGEQVILFPFASIPPGRPYAESGPIFVHADVCVPYAANNEYPTNFREHRVIRAYDSQDNMVDAQIVNGSEPEEIIDAMFRDPATAFLQARSAIRGCFTFKIERA